MNCRRYHDQLWLQFLKLSHSGHFATQALTFIFQKIQNPVDILRCLIWIFLQLQVTEALLKSVWNQRATEPLTLIIQTAWTVRTDDQYKTVSDSKVRFSMLRTGVLVVIWLMDIITESIWLMIFHNLVADYASNKLRGNLYQQLFSKFCCVKHATCSTCSPVKAHQTGMIKIWQN